MCTHPTPSINGQLFETDESGIKKKEFFWGQKADPDILWKKTLSLDEKCTYKNLSGNINSFFSFSSAAD